MTKVLGLIGSPVAHSLSPFIHNNFAALLGIDAVYTPFDVPLRPAALAAALEGAHALGICGLNITYPHKTEAAKHAELDSTAARVGAVNTLLRTGGGFAGYNTDIYGVKQAILHHGFDISGGAVILGKGAAGHAAMCALQDMGCANTTMAGREAGYLEGSLLIAALPMDADYSAHAANFDAVFDMNYTTGRPGGLAMLIYQAAASFEIFTGHNVPQNIIDKIFVSLAEYQRPGRLFAHE